MQMQVRYRVGNVCPMGGRIFPQFAAQTLSFVTGKHGLLIAFIKVHIDNAMFCSLKLHQTQDPSEATIFGLWG